MAPLPSLSLLCWFVPSALFLIFLVETVAMEEEGVTSFQRFYELCLLLLDFQVLQGQSSHLSVSCVLFHSHRDRSYLSVQPVPLSLL